MWIGGAGLSRVRSAGHPRDQEGRPGVQVQVAYWLRAVRGREQVLFYCVHFLFEIGRKVS